jgi:hypothetical protein
VQVSGFLLETKGCLLGMACCPPSTVWREPRAALLSPAHTWCAGCKGSGIKHVCVHWHRPDHVACLVMQVWRAAPLGQEL